MTSCDECGFVYHELDTAAIGPSLRAFGARYHEALVGVGTEDASLRPDPQTWSALEYSCHVRDVLLVQRERAVLAQVEERPSFARMYRDERVSLCQYRSEPIGEVLRQLSMAADLCAIVFEGISGSVWSRPVIYNWPVSAQRDLAWLARHTVHEGEHHLMDVRNILDRRN